MVDHAILLKDIYDTTLPNTIKRWLANYMSGRQSYVDFQGSKYQNPG